MKKIILLFCILLSTSINAQLQLVAKTNGGAFLIPSNSRILDLGATIGFGFYVSDKERSYMLFEIGGYGGGGASNVGTFSYNTHDKYGHLNTYDDGKINREHTLIPIFVNYNWKIMLGDNVSFHIGPTIGEISLISYNQYYVGKKKWEPESDYGENGKPKETKFKALLVAGANTGLYFRKRDGESFWGIEYRCLFNTKQSINGEIIKLPLHQISISFFFDTF
ncbi:MAG: hypothetical protein LBN95_00705 [Prevotellaceae bacterium]|jgi:hypothetical protein|nr:hypothetical protein [Prevotellaceae bacterium]